MKQLYQFKVRKMLRDLTSVVSKTLQSGRTALNTLRLVLQLNYLEDTKDKYVPVQDMQNAVWLLLIAQALLTLTTVGSLVYYSSILLTVVWSLRKGERIAQLVINQVPSVQLVEVDTLSESDRGSGGFGSTGK